MGLDIRPGMVVRFTDKRDKLRAAVVAAVVPDGEEPDGPSVVLVDFTSVSSYAGPPPLILKVDTPKAAKRLSLDPKRTSYIFERDEHLHIYGVEFLDHDHEHGVGWMPAKDLKKVQTWLVNLLVHFPDNPVHKAMYEQLMQQL